jgi:hypothetical protein
MGRAPLTDGRTGAAVRALSDPTPSTARRPETPDPEPTGRRASAHPTPAAGTSAHGALIRPAVSQNEWSKPTALAFSPSHSGDPSGRTAGSPSLLTCASASWFNRIHACADCLSAPRIERSRTATSTTTIRGLASNPDGPGREFQPMDGGPKTSSFAMDATAWAGSGEWIGRPPRTRGGRAPPSSSQPPSSPQPYWSSVDSSSPPPCLAASRSSHVSSPASTEGRSASPSPPVPSL